MEETVFMETGNDKEKKEYMNNLEVQELKRILFDTNPILFLGAGLSFVAPYEKPAPRNIQRIRRKKSNAIRC